MRKTAKATNNPTNRKTKTDSQRWDTTLSIRLRVIVPTIEPSSAGPAPEALPYWPYAP